MMKFSDYYLASGMRWSSLSSGVMFGIAAGLIFGWQIGVLVGAVVALICSFVLPLSAYLRDRPYIRIKKTLTQPLLIDERVCFTVRDGTVNGFMVLTNDAMIFLSLERGDHRLELSREDVRYISCEEGVTVNVFLNEKQFVRVISGACEEICEILRENGWTVTG
ncbi:MAG: hypothetical protein IJW29_00250 [Clostridia bacterium]|nr:hypothetical protein [Clostridia bacterium]